tara:strand:+ start:325 stop:717 length:393 start_codon:yes stop_codon:yes gene_type:complete
MANGTIAFDTLQTSGQITGTAKSLDTDYVVNGACKAWSHFTGGFSIADSFNIASVTDNATGRPEFNFTNNMGNATYSAAGHTYNAMIGGHAGSGDFTASSAPMSIIDSGGNFADVGSGQVAGINYFGDLA